MPVKVPVPEIEIAEAVLVLVIPVAPKLISPVKVRVFPFRFRLPAVMVVEAETVRAPPIFQVWPALLILNVPRVDNAVEEPEIVPEPPIFKVVLALPVMVPPERVIAPLRLIVLVLMVKIPPVIVNPELTVREDELKDKLVNAPDIVSPPFKEVMALGKVIEPPVDITRMEDAFSVSVPFKVKVPLIVRVYPL